VLGFEPVTAVNVDQLPGTPPVELGAVCTTIDKAEKPMELYVICQVVHPAVRLSKGPTLKGTVDPVGILIGKEQSGVWAKRGNASSKRKSFFIRWSVLSEDGSKIRSALGCAARAGVISFAQLK